MAAWCQVGVKSDNWQCIKLNISRKCDLILTAIFISIIYCWLENTFLNIKRWYIVCTIRFPVICDVILGAAYGQISLLFSNDYNSLHRQCIIACMHQLKDLFKIYSSMYNTTIVVCKISAQSKLEKILSTFYYQFFWPLEPLGTGCDVMTSVAYWNQPFLLLLSTLKSLLHVQED